MTELVTKKAGDIRREAAATVSPVPASMKPDASHLPRTVLSKVLARSINATNSRAAAKSSLNTSSLCYVNKRSPLPALISTLSSQNLGRGRSSLQRSQENPGPWLVMKKVYQSIEDKLRLDRARNDAIKGSKERLWKDSIEAYQRFKRQYEYNV